ncbi:activator of stress s 1 [Fusarium longipes]|uniref:Activator of stress s 1 n=1 Tax=Fusarium longipes TaxID=694270 RepID=A0A395TBA3_9HYPO|nr:activator of stress s 1 [Fusarium longipes]
MSSEKVMLSPETESIRPLFETYKQLKRVVEEHNGDKILIDNWNTTPTAVWDVLPPRTTCDALLDSYIKTFESVLRIFHVPSFLRDYEHFWETSSSVDDTFLPKLLLTIALGSTTMDSTESNLDQAARWILHVKEWLARHMIKGMRADLNMAQIACLLALTRHTHTQDVAPIGHDLTHIAVQLGLHREPRTRSPNMSAKEAEIRRRLWATMLELSLQVAIDKGLPAPIAPESYDCEPPSSIADSDLYLGVESQGGTSASVLTLLAQTQRLRLRILQLANAPGSSKTYQECHSLAAELNTTCSAGLERLQSTSKTRLSDFQIKLVDFFTRPFVMALHEPFAEKASIKPEYYYSRRMRMEISAQLLTPTKDHRAYRALLVQGHGHFYSTHRQAAMSLCLDLIRELEAGAFPGLDSSSHRNLLDLLSGSVDAFQRRVRATGGAESTSEYLLFSSAVAYMEALKQGCKGSDVDDKVLAAAKTGISFCCDVMDSQRRRRPSMMSRSGDAQGSSEVEQLWIG